MASDDQREPGQQGVPTLISGYRSRLDALRAEALELARMRKDVLAAADQAAGATVATARSEVREAVLKARRDLLGLAAQIHAALDAPQDPAVVDLAGTDEILRIQADDLRVANDVFVKARRDVRRVLESVAPDIDALDHQLAALRFDMAETREPQRPKAPTKPATQSEAKQSEFRPPEVNLPAPVAAAPDVPFRPFDPPLIPERPAGRSSRSIKPFVVPLLLLGVGALAFAGWRLRDEIADRLQGSQAEPAVTASAGAGDAATGDAAALKPVAISSAEPLSLTIETRQPSWIRVQVDGRVTSARLFDTGETQRVTASRQVSIRAGNAGGVFVSLNGAKPSALGRAGQPVTRDFTREDPGSSPSDTALQASSSFQADGTSGSARPPTSDPASPEPPASVTETATRAALATETASFAPKPEPPPAPQPSSPVAPQHDIALNAQHWLDAYSRRDRDAMAAFSDRSVSVTDERPEPERIFSTYGVRRDFSDVNIQIFGESAIFTARVTEQAPGRTASETYVSQIWNRRDNSWRLSDVRIVSRTTLDRVRR